MGHTNRWKVRNLPLHPIFPTFHRCHSACIDDGGPIVGGPWQNGLPSTPQKSPRHAETVFRFWATSTTPKSQPKKVKHTTSFPWMKVFSNSTTRGSAQTDSLKSFKHCDCKSLGISTKETRKFPSICYYANFHVKPGQLGRRPGVTYLESTQKTNSKGGCESFFLGFIGTIYL